MFPDWNVSKLIRSGKNLPTPPTNYFKSVQCLTCFSSRKLHGIQNGLMNPPSVFYIPNLERCSQSGSNIIGTEDFLLHQYELNVIWHIVEGQPPITQCIGVELKNLKHFLDASSIDFNSSIQLTFDVICQLLDVNYHILHF